MATTRTVNFSSAVIAGTRVELRNGRLMVRTSDTGRYEWDASGQLRGIDLPLNLLAMSDAVAVEFDDKRFAGQAFVNVDVSSSQGGTRTFLRLRGTGPLEGWSG